MSNAVAFPGLRVSVNGPLLEIVIERPKVNAIDSLTSCSLGRAFTWLRDDPKLRVGTLTGQGERVFSAGWDLKEAALNRSAYQANEFGGFAGIDILFSLNKPLIAAVNGAAVGGGVELALACDLVLCADHATFSLPEVSLGVMADAGGVQRLPLRVPRNVALDLLLTGRKMLAEEAAHWGLVKSVLPRDKLLSATRELAFHIAEGAPLAVAALKEVLRGCESISEREAFDAVRSGRFSTYRAMLDSQDHIEGPLAFAEKRPPRWTGR